MTRNAGATWAGLTSRAAPPPRVTMDVAHCCCGLLSVAIDAAEAIAKLTDREREVLALLGAGLMNRMIARRLGISERTVKAHVKNIIEKLGVRSRMEATFTGVIHHKLICQQPAGAGHCRDCVGPSVAVAYT